MVNNMSWAELSTKMISKFVDGAAGQPFSVCFVTNILFNAARRVISEFDF